MPLTATDDRDFPIIDFGAHLVTDVPEWMEGVDERIGPVHHDAELAIDRAERAGVDKLVLSQPPFMGHEDADRTAEANDDLLETIDRYDQLYGLAALPVGAGGEAAAEEFQRCLDRGYNGGALETESNGIKLSDNELEPVFEVAAKADAPIFVHPKLNDSLGPGALDDRFQLNAIFGREVALSESIFELIHMGILDDHPDLNLVFHHLGGNIAAMLGRVHLRLDEGRWPGQEHVLPFEEFKATLESRVYLDTSAFFGYHAPVQAAVQELPASQLLFGTDAPYEPRSSEEFTRLADTVLDLTSDTDAEAILGGNALDLLANVD